MKNKRIISVILIVLSSITFVMPFNILNADTYTETDGCTFLYSYQNTNYPNDPKTAQYVKTLSDARVVYLKDGNQIVPYVVTLDNTNKFLSVRNGSLGCGSTVPSSSFNNYSYSGTTYYYYSLSSFNPDGTSVSDVTLIDNLDIITLQSGLNSYEKSQVAYRYSYGDLAEDPVEEPTYGQLKIGFTSSIAYSGGNSNAWRDNKDTIYFDRYDTLGNDLKGLNIELQAVPYTTEASSKQTLLGQKFNEFFYDTVRVGSLGFYSPGQNPVDFTWEYITNRFSPTWWSTYGDNWSLTGWYLTDHWYKVGWCYRARVVDDEMNTIIDWQTIYNGTSIDAQDTDNIINNNGYNPDLVNSINEINNFNNTTNNNYYNNQVINYNDGELTSEGSWIEEFIRGIFETLGDIITAIIGFGSDIINGLFDLVSNLGVNLISFFRDLIDALTGADEQIDLTLPEWDPLIDEDGVLNEFKALGNGYVNMFVNSGLGYMLIIPLIIILLRLVF